MDNSLQLLSRLTEQIQDRTVLEKEYNNFFNFCPTGLSMSGPDGFFKRVNPALCGLLGYTDEELLSRPFLHFVYPDDRGPSIQESKKVRTKGHSFSFVNRYMCKNGDIKWLDWKSILDDNTKLVFGCARDITEKHQQDVLFAVAFDSCPNGQALVDNKGNFLRVNKALSDMFGYTSEELIKLNVMDITHESDLAYSKMMLNKAVSKEIDSYQFRKKYVMKTGEPFDVDLYVQPVCDDYHRVKYTVAHIVKVRS